MKKMLKLSLALSMAFSLIGCSQKEPEKPYDDFIQDVEEAMIDGTTSFNMNFLFNDPVASGFEEPDNYGIGYMEEEDAKEMYEEFKEIQTELHAYNYDNLDDVQKRTYDALDDYLSRELALEDYFYYSNSMIGSYSSTIQDLPLLLQMYAFNDVDDIENLYKDIAHFKEDFLAYAKFEKMRQEKGLGYSKKILDDTKTQIQGIIDANGEEIIQELNEVIGNLAFLNDTQKLKYQEKTKEVIHNDFIGAYKALLAELNKIEGSKENVGLYYVENGKDYYEAIVYNQLGIKDSIKDIETRLDEAFDQELLALQTFVFANQDLLEIEDLYGITYRDFSKPGEGLDYLKTKIASAVPEISDLSYRIYTVPESLQEGFAPAAYLSSRIDMKEEQDECIMINPTSTSNMFPTLVHEGYPGHMYQNSYFYSLDYPILNKLLGCIGYTEGWAIFMENKADRFLSDEKEAAWQKLLIYDTNISSIILASIDIGIHYYGWDIDDCVDFFNSKLGSSVTSEDLAQLYDIILQTPGYYLYYIYSGQILKDLETNAKDVLGDKFDEIEFNQAILDSGPIGLDMVKRNIENYIDEKK